MSSANKCDRWGKSVVEFIQDAQRERNVLEFRRLEMFGYYESPPISRWRRYWWRALDLRDRVRDAWLVLTDRAHIADD